MIIFSKESVILSYQLGKGGLPFIERQGALERVLREDSLKEEEFCFASKDGGTSYVHEYLWYPNANISVMRLGYVENCNYQYCIVVVSMDEMFPYIVVHDYQQVFKDAAEVEDTICYSLKKALGRCLECISISQCYDEEAIKWVIHRYEVYQSAVTDKKRLENKLTNYGKHKPNIKEYSDYLEVADDKKDVVMQNLHAHIDKNTSAKSVIMAIRAVEDLKIGNRAPHLAFQMEFGAGKGRDKSAYSSYLNAPKSAICNDENYQKMIKKLKPYAP
jgi:hypothetical protein